MKSTESFKQTIQSYLDNRAVTDSLFAASFSKEGKNTDLCVTYILNTVQKSGCNGFTDDEIFSMAVHYYDEDNIKVGAPANCGVVVNHHIELTDQEKKQAKEEAIRKVIADEEARLRRKTQPVVKKDEVSLQPTLF